MNPQELIKNLSAKTQGKSAEEIIEIASDALKGRLVFATSLGEEDQVITDMIARVASSITIFTLDTGRLHQETYDLWAKTLKKYNKVNFKIYFPDAKKVEEMVQSKGINLFYESVDNRKLCCGIRKVEPLQRALKDADAWITGLRRAQSITRSDAKAFEWDEANKKIKINPLVDWSRDQVKAYIKQYNVDINPLHEQGFVSIGCAPCTRAIKPGEDIRAGRWWWETPESKECGLHNNPKRKK